MLEQDAFSTRVTHSLDHRGVVHSVGEVDAAGEFGTECRESSIVCDIAGGEDEGGFLSMEICKFLLERQMHSTVASNVPGTASTMTVLVKGTTEGEAVINKEAGKNE